MGDDWLRVQEALTAAGVEGVEDFGRFVNDPRHFEPSRFDERAAMPVLLAVLPTLDDPRAVDAAAGHLCRPWARPAAFEPLRTAFLRWAPDHATTGWQLGDSLGRTAIAEHVPVLLALAEDTRFGTARQMLVLHLSRFKASPEVCAAVERLVDDPDVSLHAMSALRKCLGNEAALPILQAVEAGHPDAKVRKQAAQAIKKATKASRR
ncbi:MAG: hypothetical protein AB7O74_14180 [Candidatus Nanopelagicales bacterium]